MRVPPRLLAVLSFVVVGMVTLVVAGLLDWIVGVLFLLMEFLGEILRGVFRSRRDRRPPPARSRPGSPVHHAVEHRRGAIRRRVRPRRRRPGPAEVGPSPAPATAPAFRILVPLGGDEPELIDFALEECRNRHGELLALFLRPMSVTPMGPIPLPGLDEDEEARATLDRVGAEAERAGVPFRALYEATANRPATIGEVARDCQADMVVVGSPRRNGIAAFLRRDTTPTLLRLLPERASLMIRAS